MVTLVLSHEVLGKGYWTIPCLLLRKGDKWAWICMVVRVWVLVIIGAAGVGPVGYSDTYSPNSYVPSCQKSWVLTYGTSFVLHYCRGVSVCWG